MRTDYAIRILLFLASKGTNVTGEIICENLGLTPSYFPKTIVELRRAGWVTSDAGINGGYRLVKSPKEISVLDVMKLMEDSIKINRCLQEDHFCSRNATEICEVHKLYLIFQEIYESYFDSVSIADLMRSSAYDTLICKVCERLIEHIKATSLQQKATAEG